MLSTAVHRRLIESSNETMHRVETLDYQVQTKGEIIVVGGGIGGLLAALLCVATGWEVTLIEKNEELGGKFFTVVDANGIIMEGGAMRFSLKHLLVTWLVKILNLATTEFDNTLYYRVRNKLIPSDKVAVGDLFGGKVSNHDLTLHQLKKSLFAPLSEIMDKYHNDPALGKRVLIEQFDQYSLEGWILSQGVEPQYIEEIAQALNYSSRLRSSVVEPFLHDYLGHYTELYHIDGGSQRLIEALTNRILKSGFAKIKAGYTVTDVIQNNGHVTIRTIDSENRANIWGADKMLCVLPLPALKNVRFHGMDAKKEQAIERAYNGKGHKILATFNQPFWQEFGLKSGMQIKTHRGVAVVSPQPHTNTNGHGLILEYATGKYACDNHNDQESRVRNACKSLKAVLGVDVQPHLDNYWIVDWCNRAGGMGPLLQPRDSLGVGFHHLLRPFGNVYFAGEYQTLAYQRWAEGTLRSVMRNVCALNDNNDGYLAYPDD